MAESPGLMLGEGTVLTEGQVKKVVKAGVRFFVSPGFDVKVVDWCLAAKVRAIMQQMREKQSVSALTTSCTRHHYF